MFECRTISLRDTGYYMDGVGTVVLQLVRLQALLPNWYSQGWKWLIGTVDYSDHILEVLRVKKEGVGVWQRWCLREGVVLNMSDKYVLIVSHNKSISNINSFDFQFEKYKYMKMYLKYIHMQRCLTACCCCLP